MLAKVKHAVLNPYVLGRLLTAELERQAQAPDAVKAQREELSAKVSRLAAETVRLVDAVAAGGGDVKALVTRLKETEAGHRDALAALEHANGLAIEAEDFDIVEWVEETRELLDDLKATLEADPHAGRQTLKRLLTSPIVVTPRVEADGTIVFGFRLECSFLDVEVSPDGMTGEVKAVENQEVSGGVKRRVQRWCPRGEQHDFVTVPIKGVVRAA